MNENLKKIIIVIAIICILMIILLCFLIGYQRNNQESAGLTEVETPTDAYDIEQNKVQSVQIRSDVYLIKECIEKFVTSNDNTKIFNMLDSEYISMFNSITDNLNNKFKNYEEVNIDITNMYFVQVNKGINVYFAYGNLIDKTTNTLGNLAIGIKIDNNNNTFSVLPYEYLEKNEYLNLNVGNTLNLNQIDKIENKKDNTFEYEYVNDEKHITYLFTTFINRCLYNNELAYKYLNTEYSEKRFGSLQEFQSFVLNHKDVYLSQDMKNAKQYGDFNSIEEYMIYMSSFKSLKLEKYQILKEDNYTQYVCIDNYNNYYIFKEEDVLNYSVILDTYTIDLPEFVEKYNEASDDEKILYNIQKVFEAINSGDYKYVYNKLDETFKSNYFKTQESFENYVKEKWYINNDVSYGTYEKNGEVYVYNLQIKDADNKANQTVSQKIVMKLKEGTDFVMSFSVE